MITDPSQIFGVKRDPFQVETVAAHRIPTEFMIQYIDRRWRRVYAKWKGQPYIVMMEREIEVDADTALRLVALTPRELTDDEWSKLRNEADVENIQRDTNWLHQKLSSPEQDWEIPF